MIRNKKECPMCKKLISLSNIRKHLLSCKGIVEPIQLNYEGRYICPYCNKEFSKYGIKNHIEVTHKKSRSATGTGKVPWNKGLNKENSDDIRILSEKLSNKYKSGELVHYCKNKTIPNNIKQKISDSMKKAHTDGRAWNIGKSRWNNKPSYPEIFFMKVIENEFQDKNYKREFAISIWSFDFAWPHLMRAIEIDGDQHNRFIEYKDRDKRKDMYAMSNGWEILRIPWKELYNNTKYWIQVSKDFIHSVVLK